MMVSERAEMTLKAVTSRQDPVLQGFSDEQLRALEEDTLSFGGGSPGPEESQAS